MIYLLNSVLDFDIRICFEFRISAIAELSVFFCGFFFT